MYLVLIETSGNQHYIFSTNKLRENVGASELTYQIGTKVVMEAIGKSSIIENDTDGNKLRTFLVDEEQNPFTSNDGHQIEVIIATSGKALLLVNDFDKAKSIVSFVTKHALTEMPGLTVHGAISEVKDDLTDIHHAVGEVHRKLEEIRYQIPTNQSRFQRLPFVEPCATSGLPANEIYRHESLKDKPNELKSYSSVSAKKQKISDQGRMRLKGTINSTSLNVTLPGNINELEKTFPDTNWLAIIHADGNGLGEIFLKFDKYLDYPTKDFDGRFYLDQYRKFSLALDDCTIKATVEAVKNLQIEITKPNSKNKTEYDEVPIIPLILGGDDLTVICDGKYAIKFTYDFLTEFENQTSQNPLIKSIAKNAFGVERLGICAGVAIIKPHYPFHQAYSLAKNLIKSAKLVKTKIQHAHNGKNVSLPCSAMDFHVLYDSSGVELKQIREKLIVDNGKTYLFAKPYVVTDENKLKENLTFNKDGEFENKWLNHRTWKHLETRVCAMSAPEKEDEGKRKLPNSQLHHIRESLFRGQAETDSEINLFKHRYKDKDFDKLLCKKKSSLFFDEKHKESDQEFGHTTHFLDALDVVELWKGFECPKTENGGNE